MISEKHVHKHGFVKLLEVMGSDEEVENAARISYGTGTRKVSQTRNLIRYLMRHQHTSPFEMCEVCLLYTSPSPRDVEESRMPSSA